MTNLAALNLNVEDEARPNYEALPPGEYIAVASDSEMKSNKSNDGQHLSITFDIVEGQMEGRKLWSNYNVVNPNPDAERIGRSELAALCKAAGVANPKDSSELHGKPVILVVGIDKKDASRNVVKGYKPATGAEAPAPKAATKPAASATPPWKRK